MFLSGIFTAIGNMVPIVFPKLIIDELTNSGDAQHVIVLAVVFGITMLIANCITGTSSGSMSIRFIALRVRFAARLNKKFMTMDFQKLENPDVLKETLIIRPGRAVKKTEGQKLHFCYKR
jgi:ABC-type bacteriocin/lantibiotic exporter with double-glycine peptidase domain